MCVLCHRKMVQSLFYDIVYASVPCKAVIQKYGNICGQDNEYAREVTLVCPHNGPVHCMPFPSVSHQRNRYRLDTNGNGVKYIRQIGMSHQDFRKAPSKVSYCAWQTLHASGSVIGCA